GITVDQSLPVEMVIFTAKILENAIILKWQTATETNNLGFNIYRSQAQYGRYQKINSKLIKGAGTNAMLCKYSFQDDDIDPSQVYFYYIEDIDFFGNTEKSQVISIMPDKGIVIMINEPWASLENKLLQNFPNPFNPETWIPYELSEPAEVEIRIFNYYGNLVKILYLGKKFSGVYYDKNKSAYWDGKNEIKESVASGIYFYQIKAGKFTAFKKMILLK
ncbi:hypothetical protein CL633_02615, partial [bacterium]|nr:hypothetical protein [bacterium]